MVETIETDFHVIKLIETNHEVIENFSLGHGSVAKNFPPTANQWLRISSDFSARHVCATQREASVRLGQTSPFTVHGRRQRKWPP